MTIRDEIEIGLSLLAVFLSMHPEGDIDEAIAAAVPPALLDGSDRRAGKARSRLRAGAADNWREMRFDDGLTAMDIRQIADQLAPAQGGR